jgi:hypothetical protein
MRLWDAFSFLLFAGVLGAFSFWLTGYFAVECVKYFLKGPSDQLKTVGTSILDEPPLETRETREERPYRRVA